MLRTPPYIEAQLLGISPHDFWGSSILPGLPRRSYLLGLRALDFHHSRPAPGRFSEAGRDDDDDDDDGYRNDDDCDNDSDNAPHEENEEDKDKNANDNED
jgi:hypothetical protein